MVIIWQIISSDDNPFVTPNRKSSRKRGRRDADDGDDPSGGAGSKKAKVTASDFTPRTLRLGHKSKKVLVLATATENPYPGAPQRMTNVADVIKRVATDPAADTGLLETYERIVKLPQVFENLVTWVSSYISGLTFF